MSPLREAGTRLPWELRRGARRFLRRFGAAGCAVAAAVAVALLAAVVDARQRQSLADVQRALALRSAMPAPAPGAQPRSRMEAFDDVLLDPPEVPTVVRSLLRLAEDSQLAIVRGDYRPQPDVPGRFMRYRMTLPVQGDAQAIHRYMQAALREHRTLAIESVQFKRERIDARVVEARIQWVVLTRLRAPAAADGGTR